MTSGGYFPRWFSRRREGHPVFTSPKDFTSAFWREVLPIRQKFHLQNDSFGVDVPLNTSDCWQSYQLDDHYMGLHQEIVLVAVSQFRWSCIEPSVGESAEPLVPRFQLDMHLAMMAEEQERKRILGHPKLPANLDAPPGCIVFHSYTLTVEFNSQHPIFEPQLYIGSRPETESAHEHHWFTNGNLCIFPASTTDEGWAKLGRSTVRWIGLAVAWSAWHVQNFGY